MDKRVRRQAKEVAGLLYGHLFEVYRDLSELAGELETKSDCLSIAVDAKCTDPNSLFAGVSGSFDLLREIRESHARLSNLVADLSLHFTGIKAQIGELGCEDYNVSKFAEVVGLYQTGINSLIRTLAIVDILLARNDPLICSQAVKLIWLELASRLPNADT